jgi:hypothetical protein
MRKAPNEAAVASLRGFGRAITSIKVKTKIHRVRTTQSSSSEKAEGPLLENDPSASNYLSFGLLSCTRYHPFSDKASFLML